MSGAPQPAVFYTRGALAPRAFPDAVPPTARPPLRTRARIWELNGSIHCSIIGTCLTTAELRRVMAKVLHSDAADATDHDLHARAVGLCTHQSPAAKLLQKALDKRHEGVVKRFGRLVGEAAVLAAWGEARAAGDIPGAYWAVLTHPDTGIEGIRRAFGDVHMLSHLVGAANRADIRRLTALEEENAVLRTKMERQQLRLQEAVTSRDATIRQLGALAADHAGAAASRPADDDALAGLRHLVLDLQARLGREVARRERLDQRVAEMTEANRRCERRASAAETRECAIRRELLLLEQAPLPGGDPGPVALPPMLPAEAILYVGGRPAVVGQAGALLGAAGGTLLTHDGGRHDHPSLLPGLIGQARQVVFPVDCVSHDAVLTVKRICRQLGTRFVPLRSSGLASFLAAVGGPIPEIQP